MNREALREMGISDENIEKIMADYSKGIQAEKAKQEALRGDANKLTELTKQLEAMKKAESEKDKVVEGKDKDLEAMQTQLAELQAQIKAKELKANLAEQGITGERADKLIESLNGGNFDVTILAEILADREKSAVDAKVKELTEGATNPNGGKSGDEKPDDVKNAETINFGGLAENVQQTRDFYK